MRISEQFKRLKEQKRPGLITYMMAYDPALKESEALLHALPEAGADLIELGMPFSDPAADGPIIQAAGMRALKAGATLAGILKLVSSFRTKNDYTPLILMGYYNPVYHYGAQRFVEDAKQAGVDGLLIVDLPPEEDTQMLACCDYHGIELIKLVTPVTDKQRLDVILPKARGFLYYVSITGITGTKVADAASIERSVQKIRKQTKLPLVAGFGIKTPQDVTRIAPYVDAVVVGSAVIQALEEKGVQEAIRFVTQLRQAL